MKEPEIFDDPDRVFTEHEKRRIYDFYITNENNGIKEISEAFGVSAYRIHGVINRFFQAKEQFEILPSKMNDEDYED